MTYHFSILRVRAIDIAGIQIMVFGNLFSPVVYGQAADGSWRQFYAWQRLV